MYNYHGYINLLLTTPMMPRLHRRCLAAASALHQQHRAPRLLISRSHGFYMNYVDLAMP
jgi:hypothetical protein